MAIDVVCGMRVDEKKAPARSTFQGKEYVFCGKSCKEAFDEDPQRYVLEQEPANTME